MCLTWSLACTNNICLLTQWLAWVIVVYPKQLKDDLALTGAGTAIHKGNPGFPAPDTLPALQLHLPQLQPPPSHGVPFEIFTPFLSASHPELSPPALLPRLLLSRSREQTTTFISLSARSAFSTPAAKKKEEHGARWDIGLISSKLSHVPEIPSAAIGCLRQTDSFAMRWNYITWAIQCPD